MHEINQNSGHFDIIGGIVQYSTLLPVQEKCGARNCSMLNEHASSGAVDKCQSMTQQSGGNCKGSMIPVLCT